MEPNSLAIVRIADRTAYARNGNAHRPSVYYRYDIVDAQGRVYGTCAKRRDAVVLLPLVVAELRERVAQAKKN